MCGIAGIVSANAGSYRSNIQSMAQALKHRGPDGEGFYNFQNCAFGHTRLSIIDLGGGCQPMLSPDRSCGVVFNGEIYGYKKIRRNLNYPYQTQSDTEVILALYKAHGMNMLRHLPGMFAFGLWDEQGQSLFCARDRFGEKPFYYALGRNKEFIFASEIKGILASRLVDPQLNPQAIAHYLHKLYVHPTQSIYTNIFSLPPAYCLVYKNGTFNVSRYWDLPSEDASVTPAQAVEKFRWLLDQSVEKQLVADVPVGVFLSGGLDSSTIVALAKKHKPDVATFSFGFEGSKSELPFAREVAAQYQTRHVELFESQVRLDDLLLKMQEVYDEPFADSSNIPTYLIAKLAKEHIKVVMGGDGGDELLAGYASWYKPLLQLQSQMGHPDLIFKLVADVIRFYWKSGLPIPTRYARQVRKLDSMLHSQTIAEAHNIQNQYFYPDEVEKLGLTPWQPEGTQLKTNTVEDALRADIRDYLPGDILVKTDRATMANGLELRAPFLDVDFAQFCITLPYTFKLSAYEDKKILRHAFGSHWPPSVSKRGKQGFGAPVSKWLKRPEISSLKKDFLLDPQKKIYSVLNGRQLSRYAQNDDYKTWSLLVLSIWLEKHKV